MACCLMATSHYLNQNWLIINRFLWHSPDNKFTWNSRYQFIKMFKNKATFSMWQWVLSFDVWYCCQWYNCIANHAAPSIIYKSLPNLPVIIHIPIFLTLWLTFFLYSIFAYGYHIHQTILHSHFFEIHYCHHHFCLNHKHPLKLSIASLTALLDNNAKFLCWRQYTESCRLIHSHSVVAVGLTVWYESWFSIGWHKPLVIGWSEYRLGVSDSKCTVGIPAIFNSNWQMITFRAVQGDYWRIYNFQLRIRTWLINK